MKITTDVNSGGFRPLGNVSPRSSTESRSINVSDAKVAQDVIVKIQKDKSYIEALAIAQSSRDLVQKALNISARLMSLASEAMITGRVNIDEVAGQMSSIMSSMGGYGEKVSVPVQNTPVPADDIDKKIDESFARLKEKANLMFSGKPVAKKDFEPITVNLKGTASEIDAKIIRYSSELGSVKNIDTSNFNFPGLNNDMANLITKHPIKALETQGNINNEIAGKLTMA